MQEIVLAEEILKRSDAVIQLEYLQKAIERENLNRKSFYEWITEDIKAEFINGDIIVHSPVNRQHWQTNDLLSTLLSVYTSLKNLGRIGTNKVMISLSRNDYEPDLVFFSQDRVATFTPEQVRFPAPDFVVEILSPSTAKQDRTTKKNDYALHGIAEYWIIDPKKQLLEQYILQSDGINYFPAKTLRKGQNITSKVITGFEIDVAALFDEAENLKAMQSFF